MTGLLAGLGWGLILIAGAPGLTGVLRWMKARGQGRRRGGAVVLQPYRDLVRLMRQPAVRTRTASRLFVFAPVVLWASYGTLAFAVPLFAQPPLLRIDLIAFIYLLALARFALALAGMDAGAPFGGLGSARSMFLNLPTELALILICAALSLHFHTLSLTELVARQYEAGWEYLRRVDLLLIAAAFFVTLSLEAARIPVDNPGTHQELTMSHKAITLDYAGRDLALIEWGEAVKLGVLLALFVSLFLMPLTRLLTADWPILFGGPCFAVGLVLVGAALALLAGWESVRPRMRLRKAVQPALLAVGLCLSAVLYFVITKGVAR